MKLLDTIPGRLLFLLFCACVGWALAENQRQPPEWDGGFIDGEYRCLAGPHAECPDGHTLVWYEEGFLGGAWLAVEWDGSSTFWGTPLYGPPEGQDGQCLRVFKDGYRWGDCS